MEDRISVLRDAMQTQYDAGNLKGCLDYKQLWGFWISRITNKVQMIKGNQAERNYCLSGSLVPYQCGEAIVPEGSVEGLSVKEVDSGLPFFYSL